MACYSPLIAYQLVNGSVVFAERGDIQRTLSLSCGQCIGCRLERARQWSVRCMHEASLWEHNCFVTLTYDDAHLPKHSSLDYSHFQGFMRRLRRHVVNGKPVRYFVGGEYGGSFGRPHFHACIFNWDFTDKKYLMKSGAGSVLYDSDVLSKLWPFGFSSIGDVTFESAGYVARYCCSKVNGDMAAKHYEVIDSETGEVVRRQPEFGHMSLKPGIGMLWLHRWLLDVYPSGRVLARGRKSKAPRFYDTLYRRICGDDAWEELCLERDLLMRANAADNTVERLKVKEIVTKAAVSFLRRS